MSFGTTGVTLSTKITEKEYWSTSPQPAFGKQFQKYRNERRIAFSQFGRKIYVKRSDLDRFLESHRIEHLELLA